MKRVLVTGANGFIGHFCLPLLAARGYEVHAVSRTPPRNGNAQMSDIRWHQTNLLDVSQTNQLFASVKPTHLLHFAWYMEHGKVWNAIENFQWVEASLVLLRNFNQYGGDRIVMAGTCAEYEWGKEEKLTEYQSLLQPNSTYGICKNELQTMLAEFARQTEIRAAWGRVFFTYGPREAPSKLVPSIICSLLKNEVAQCSHGNQIRDYLYVCDIADAFVSLLDSEVTGAVNIASGQATQLKEIIYIITDMLKQSDKVQFGKIPSPKNEPAYIVADVSRLTDEVDWKPQYSLAQGIEQTVEWWRQNLI